MKKDEVKEPIQKASSVIEKAKEKGDVMAIILIGLGIILMMIQIFD